MKEMGTGKGSRSRSGERKGGKQEQRTGIERECMRVKCGEGMKTEKRGEGEVRSS